MWLCNGPVSPWLEEGSLGMSKWRQAGYCRWRRSFKFLQENHMEHIMDPEHLWTYVVFVWSLWTINTMVFVCTIKTIVSMLINVWGIISCVFLKPWRGWVNSVSYTWASTGCTRPYGPLTHIYNNPPPHAGWAIGAAVYKTGQERKKVTHKPPPPSPPTGTTSRRLR
jgi:hypothetical protein